MTIFPICSDEIENFSLINDFLETNIFFLRSKMMTILNFIFNDSSQTL